MSKCVVIFHRHMAFLLHSMHDHLSDAEKNELSGLLENFAKQCSGSVPASGNQMVTSQDVSPDDVPPVSLTRMPLVR